MSFLNASKEDESLTSPEIWKKFAAAWHALKCLLKCVEDIFVRVAGFFTHRLALEGYLTATCEEFLSDGVTHLELSFLVPWDSQEVLKI